MTRVRVARQNDINTWASREFQSSQINCFPRTSRSVFRVAASRFCPTSATRLSSSSVLSFLCSHRTLHLLLLILDWACTGDQVSERRKCSAVLRSVRLMVSLLPSCLFPSHYFYYEPGLLVLDTEPGWEGLRFLRGVSCYPIFRHDDIIHSAREALEIGQEGCLDPCPGSRQCWLSSSCECKL